MRGGGLAELLSRGDPDAFVVAASLDDADRTAILRDVVRWLGGVRQASRLPLLAWLDEPGWAELVAIARAALYDADELVRERGEAVIEEAERQMPHLVGADDVRTPTLHVAFERGHVRHRWPHPTQVTPPPDASRLRFGGSGRGTCGICHAHLHHLLSVRGLDFATCLSCLGWEQPFGDYALSYRHDERGEPTPLDRLDSPVTPRFPTAPFAETAVALVDLGPRFRRQNWGGADRGANLNRVGGEPTWVQGSELRPCRDCGNTMSFVFQLDSELPQSDGRTFAFGSGGILYAQCCEGCRISTLLWQCT